MSDPRLFEVHTMLRRIMRVHLREMLPAKNMSRQRDRYHLFTELYVECEDALDLVTDMLMEEKK